MDEYIDWNITHHEINELVKNIIKTSNNDNNLLSNYDFNKNSYHKFISILADNITVLSTNHSIFNFLKCMSPNKDIRNACNDADNMLSNHINMLNSRLDIYKQIVLLKSECSTELTEDIFFLNKIISTYKKEGVNFNQDSYEKFNKIKNRINNLENDIMINIVNYDKYIGISLDDIDGMPLDIIDQLPIIDKNPLKYGIHITPSIYNLCMTHINSSEVRRKIDYIYNTKCMENLPKMLELTFLRNLLSKMLSYENYTNLKTENLMAKDYNTIQKFLMELLDKLNDQYVKELSMLNKIKHNDYSEQKIELDTLNEWDIDYYIGKWKLMYGIDDNTIKEYFPLKRTITEILLIYEELFNIKITKINTTNVWHDSVEYYEVSLNDNIIGYFYLDLFDRDQKLKCRNCFNIKSPCKYPLNDNIYQIPISILAMDLNPNEQFLYHNDLTTLFHEMSHIMHQIFGRSKYHMFSGTNVEHDFVEVIGLLYEKASWEVDILKRISCHYLTKEKLSDDNINKMHKIRNMDVGIRFSRLILKSYYDHIIHSSDKFIDLIESILTINDNNERLERSTKVMIEAYTQLHNKILTTKTVDNKTYEIKQNIGTYPPASWFPLVNGNGSLYYSELWSEVYATDIYSTKFNYNILNPNENIDFIKNVLEGYGQKTSYDKLCIYLNRTPNQDGFLQYYNLIPFGTEYSFFFNSNNDTNDNNIFQQQIDSDVEKPYIISSDSDEDSEEYTNRFVEDYTDNSSNNYTMS